MAEKWEETKPYAAVKARRDRRSRPKFYGLIRFPYPSAAGLHVGHPRPFTAMDIICRKKRMQGYNVLNPIDFDAFGLPTENFAIKAISIRQLSRENIENFTRQLRCSATASTGTALSTRRQTEYYKWTQWIFLQMYKHGCGLQDHDARQRCTAANACWQTKKLSRACAALRRAGHPQGKSQWMLRITKYADRLIDDLDGLDYIERVKTQQKNWIGRSTGTEVTFKTNTEDDITAYTTRVDTLFGVTYTVISRSTRCSRSGSRSSKTGRTWKPISRRRPGSPTLSAAN